MASIFLANCSTDSTDSTKQATENEKAELTTSKSIFEKVEEVVKVEKPKTYHDAIGLARKANDDKEYEKAIQYASYAVELAPEQGQGYYERGYAIYNFGEYSSKQAVKDLEKAKQLEFFDSSGYDTLANLYLSLDKKDKALENLNQALKLDPKRKYLYQIRASILSEKGKREEALADLGKFIELKPNNLRGYLVRAKFLQSYGKDIEALADFTKAKEVTAHKKDLGYMELLKLRAELLSKLNRNDEAIEDLSLAVEIFDEDEDAYRMRGDQYLKQKKYKQAIKDYTTAIEISPRFARASYQARANAYKQMGDLDKAASDQKKADELDTKPAEQPVFKMKKK